MSNTTKGDTTAKKGGTVKKLKPEGIQGRIAIIEELRKLNNQRDDLLQAKAKLVEIDIDNLENHPRLFIGYDRYSNSQNKLETSNQFYLKTVKETLLKATEQRLQELEALIENKFQDIKKAA